MVEMDVAILVNTKYVMELALDTAHNTSVSGRYAMRHRRKWDWALFPGLGHGPIERPPTPGAYPTRTRTR